MRKSWTLKCNPVHEQHESEHRLNQSPPTNRIMCHRLVDSILLYLVSLSVFSQSLQKKQEDFNMSL